MSARDELIEILDAKGPHHLFTSEEVADDILRRHAHELAEKIRNDREPWEWALAGQHAGKDAADLIDPESDRE